MVDDLISCLLNKNRDNFFKIYEELRKEGYDNNDILQNIINKIKDKEMDENLKIKFVDVLNNIYLVINELDTDLQMKAGFVQIFKFLENIK